MLDPIPSTEPLSAPRAETGVDTLLGGLRSQLRGAIAGRLVWQGLAALALFLWLGVAGDRLFEPEPSTRLAALVAGGVGAIAWFVLIGLPSCWRRLTDRQIVTLLHASAPEKASLIATALDLRRQPDAGNPSLADATHAAADRAAESLAGTRLVREASSYGSAWFATTALAGALALAAVRPDLAHTFVDRLALSESPWPRRVELVAEGFEYDPASHAWVAVAARGEPIEIEVTARVATGQVPPPTVWVRGATNRRGGLGSFVRVGPPVSDGRVLQKYRHRIERLEEDQVLPIRGGDASLELRLVAADRPRLTDVVVTCQPPDYLGTAPYQATAATLTPFPEGSKLTVRASTSKEIADGRVTLRRESSAGQDLPWQAVPEGLGMGAVLPPLEAPCVVTLAVTDTSGLDSEPLGIPLEVARDTPPRVRLTLDGVRGVVTRDARVPFLVQLDDDHGLRAVAVRVARGDSGDTVELELQPPPALPGGARGEVDLLSLRSAATGGNLVVEPGDRLTLIASATDRYDLAERVPSDSQPIGLEVVTHAELLARLGDEQCELRRQVDGLLADTQRLEYELDLEGRRLAEVSAQRPEDPARLIRWAAERRLDARKAADGVGEVAKRADFVRQQAVNNRLDQSALIDRLATAVVRPLRRVVERRLSSAREHLDTIGGARSVERIGGAEAEVARAAAALERVAASLDSQQSYNEVVALLRGLVREQRRVNQKTTRERDQSVRGLFD